MNYDPEKAYASMSSEKRAEYDRMTKRIEELERAKTPAPPEDPKPTPIPSPSDKDATT